MLYTAESKREQLEKQVYAKMSHPPDPPPSHPLYEQWLKLQAETKKEEERGNGEDIISDSQFWKRGNTEPKKDCIRCGYNLPTFAKFCVSCGSVQPLENVFDWRNEVSEAIREEENRDKNEKEDNKNEADEREGKDDDGGFPENEEVREEVEEEQVTEREDKYNEEDNMKLENETESTNITTEDDKHKSKPNESDIQTSPDIQEAQNVNQTTGEILGNSIIEDHPIESKENSMVIGGEQRKGMD